MASNPLAWFERFGVTGVDIVSGLFRLDTSAYGEALVARASCATNRLGQALASFRCWIPVGFGTNDMDWLSTVHLLSGVLRDRVDLLIDDGDEVFVDTSFSKKAGNVVHFDELERAIEIRDLPRTARALLAVAAEKVQAQTLTTEFVDHVEDSDSPAFRDVISAVEWSVP